MKCCNVIGALTMFMLAVPLIIIHLFSIVHSVSKNINIINLLILLSYKIYCNMSILAHILLLTLKDNIVLNNKLKLCAFTIIN